MLTNKEVLYRVAAALSEGDLETVEDWFTEDFKLHDPAAPDWPSGHVGARRMLASIREAVPRVSVEALDMVEEGDRVAVRWQFTGDREGQPVRLSTVDIYRFANGRIAEDWGVVARAAWPE